MVHSSCNMFRSLLSSAMSFDVRLLNRKIHTAVSWTLDLHKALNFNAVDLFQRGKLKAVIWNQPFGYWEKQRILVFQVVLWVTVYFCLSVSLQIYTDWANHYLAKSGHKRLIKDLQQDVTDGVLLAEIIQVVGEWLSVFVPSIHQLAQTVPVFIFYTNTVWGGGIHQTAWNYVDHFPSQTLLINLKKPCLKA